MYLNQITQSNKRCWLSISFFLFSLIQCYSQKQGNIWYFGGDYPNSGGAGLDFNSGSPIPLFNSAIPFTNGCASYCNSKGELLFYANGESIFDRTHHLMLNGNNLGGDSLTPQSVLIVPFTNDSNSYYIFTNDGSHSGNGTVNGLHYSIVNMSLNNGLGAVTNLKAKSLLKKHIEQLTGCNHFNGKDFWVIAIVQDSCKLYAYQVTDVGIMSPVVSYLGLDYAIYNVEISPKGNKLALKARNGNQFYRYIIDFNPEVGIFSNPFPLSGEYDFNAARNTGCSFSSDGNYFYNDEYTNSGGDSLFQYYLNTSDIISTKTFITKLISNYDMQIGPDGKIYFGGGVNRLYIDYIEFPNVQGINCGYHKNGIYLGGRNSGNILPNENLVDKRFTTTTLNSNKIHLNIEFNYATKQLMILDAENKKYNIQIYDLYGNQVLSNEIYNNYQVDLTFLHTGLYIYSMESESKILQTGKILIYQE